MKIPTEDRGILLHCRYQQSSVQSCPGECAVSLLVFAQWVTNEGPRSASVDDMKYRSPRVTVMEFIWGVFQALADELGLNSCTAYLSCPETIH